VREFFKKVRKRTADICAPISPEDSIPQPAVFVSPAKWHLGHTTWFFEEFVLSKYNPDYKRFDEDFAFLFNSYYNLVGERIQRNSRGNLTRPKLDLVYQYRAYVEQAILALSDDVLEEAKEVLELGLNHEQQHEELLLTDLKFILSQNPLKAVYKKDFDLAGGSQGAGEWLKISEGLHSIGNDGKGFAYDNEFGRHKVYLNAFEIYSELVTCGDYLEFIEDGAYERFELWLDEGWAWIQDEKIKAPLYWFKEDKSWKRYSLAGVLDLNNEEILSHISYYEAAAYAEWKGLRLPTEAEWEIASEHFNWGQRWEWTNSAYLAYPGFAKPEGSVGEYNGKFMINQMVLRGASSATSEGHSRATYRNFFHPHYQWQFSGIRLAK